MGKPKGAKRTRGQEPADVSLLKNTGFSKHQKVTPAEEGVQPDTSPVRVQQAREVAATTSTKESKTVAKHSHEKTGKVRMHGTGVKQRQGKGFRKNARRHREASTPDPDPCRSSHLSPKSDKAPSDGNRVPIDLLSRFREQVKAWPKDMSRLLDPSLDEDRRVRLWEIMCEGGDMLRQRYAWAIPDERALRIIKHFGPIVEVGSGLGYWAMLLRARDVDVNAYDKVGGAPTDDEKRAEDNDRKTAGSRNDADIRRKAAPSCESRFWTKVEERGPDVLEEEDNENRSLLLCYPDDFEEESESLGLRCLHSFEGDIVIHVGELFGDSVGMNPSQSPWGRTTSPLCQEELASKFHCIIKVPLPRWPHSRDSLTVWKRHTFCAIQYGDDDDGESSQDGDVEAAIARENISGGRRSLPTATFSRSDSGTAGAGSGDSGEGSGAFDDHESVESQSVGAPDMDMYAFVPDDEQMVPMHAAPCVAHLLRS